MPSSKCFNISQKSILTIIVRIEPPMRSRKSIFKTEFCVIISNLVLVENSFLETSNTTLVQNKQVLKFGVPNKN